MKKLYSVTFYDEDGVTVLDRQEVEKGIKVEYQGNIPMKPNQRGIEYIFDGWETVGDINNVTENITLKAKYLEVTDENRKDFEDKMYRLSEINAENAAYSNVIMAGKKVESIVQVVEKMTPEEVKNLVAEVKAKGSVDLKEEKDNER